ncbi:hypothetical protein ACFLZ7_02050 [Nanoarchaeota archaeon]
MKYEIMRQFAGKGLNPKEVKEDMQRELSKGKINAWLREDDISGVLDNVFFDANTYQRSRWLFSREPHVTMDAEISGGDLYSQPHHVVASREILTELANYMPIGTDLNSTAKLESGMIREFPHPFARMEFSEWNSKLAEYLKEECIGTEIVEDITFGEVLEKKDDEAQIKLCYVPQYGNYKDSEACGVMKAEVTSRNQLRARQLLLALAKYEPKA